MSSDSSFSAAVLAGLAIAALAGCGPDTGASGPAASASIPSASASLPSASASAASAAVAAPPACPPAPTLTCPAPSEAPATSKLASAQAASAHHWSARAHVHHRRVVFSERDRRGGDELMGGPSFEPRVERHELVARSDSYGLREGYRMEQEERETSRSESSRFGGAIVRSQGCPDNCGDWRDEGHRFYRTAGVDERGFLVWPGKVEY